MPRLTNSDPAESKATCAVHGPCHPTRPFVRNPAVTPHTISETRNARLSHPLFVVKSGLRQIRFILEACLQCKTKAAAPVDRGMPIARTHGRSDFVPGGGASQCWGKLSYTSGSDQAWGVPFPFNSERSPKYLQNLYKDYTSPTANNPIGRVDFPARISSKTRSRGASIFADFCTKVMHPH